jgi:ATP-dependent phosphofructokinase / diphosphate-dependent phosphofructokinase
LVEHHRDMVVVGGSSPLALILVLRLYKHMGIFYAQSGGVTAVLNATAAGIVWEASRLNLPVFMAPNGLMGLINGQSLVRIPTHCAEALAQTPGAAVGSCRYKLKPSEQEPLLYEKMFETLRNHHIQYILYQGGGDSQDTALKLHHYAQPLGIACLGLPKTIDNDLCHTDCSPGFGSAAKYLAISMQEAILDLLAMHHTSTKIFIMETMGRHTGWLAASTALVKLNGLAVDTLVMPEVPLDLSDLLNHVDNTLSTKGYAIMAIAEGVHMPPSVNTASAVTYDAFGHRALGGRVATAMADHMARSLKQKVHFAIPDYLQRSARHIASKTDYEQSLAIGKQAVLDVIAGHSGTMLTLVRDNDQPYTWHIDHVPLAMVANQESSVPEHFRQGRYSMSEAWTTYAQPLILGEQYPSYHQGLPHYQLLTC